MNDDSNVMYNNAIFTSNHYRTKSVTPEKNKRSTRKVDLQIS